MFEAGFTQPFRKPTNLAGDIVTVAQANAFLMIPPDKLDWAAGEWAMVLPRSGPGGGLS